MASSSSMAPVGVNDANAGAGGPSTTVLPRFQLIIDKIVASTSAATREAHAKSLSENVENFWRHNTRAAHELESKNLEAVLEKLVESPDTSRCLAGIAAFRALLTTTNEAHHSRLVRTGTALWDLLKTKTRGEGDAEISIAVANLIALFSAEKGRAVTRTIRSFYKKSKSSLVAAEFLLSEPPGVGRAKRENMTIRDCLIISKVVPMHEFHYDSSLPVLLRALLRLTAIENVRNYAVSCIAVILSTCVKRRDAKRTARAAMPRSPSTVAGTSVAAGGMAGGAAGEVMGGVPGGAIGGAANGTAVAGGSVEEDEKMLDMAFHVVHEYCCRILNEHNGNLANIPALSMPCVLGALELLCSLFENQALVSFLVDASAEVDTDLSCDYFTELGVYFLVYAGCEDLSVQHSVGVGFSCMARMHPEKFCSREYFGASGGKSFMELCFDFLTFRARNLNLSLTARQFALKSAGDVVIAVGPVRFEPYLKRALDIGLVLLRRVVAASEATATAGAATAGETVSASVTTAAAENATAVGGAIPAVAAIGSDPNLESAFLPESCVLEFMFSVSSSTKPQDKLFLAKSKALIGPIVKNTLSPSLLKLLNRFCEVNPQGIILAGVQRAVLGKVKTVFDNAVSVNFESVPKAGVATARGTRSSSEFLSCRQVDGLFIGRSDENSEPGYVSALTDVRRSAPGAQSESVRDVTFDFELQMDPEHRQRSTSPARVVVVTPRIALQTLGSFSFSHVTPNVLAHFANWFVVRFLESPSIIERRQGVVAISNMMSHAVAQNQKATDELMDKAYMVLIQVVSLAAVDPSRRVRLTALKELNAPAFELYMAQQEVLPILSLCLHDEDFGVRAQALKLISGLLKHNAAGVEPVLSQLVYHVLAMLRCHSSTFIGLRAQSARLLQMLVVEAPKLTKKYASSVTDVLIGCLKHELIVVTKVDPNSTLPVIQAIGDIARISDVMLQPYIDDLVPLLVKSVLDVDCADISFQLVSLTTLARVVQNIGVTGRPYETDKRLLPRLVANLKGGMDPQIRHATLLVLGAIGASDPEQEDVKYVALPTGRTVSLSQTGTAVPRTGTYSIHHGMMGESIGVGSVGALSTGLAGAASTGASGEGEDSPSSTSATQSALHRPAMLFECRRPPFVANAATGTDLDWVAAALSQQTPVWELPELSTNSLVNRLDHPFTDSELYFPSVVLDILHEIVGQSRHAPQHLDAVDCIVNMSALVKASHKCSYFLPSMVPRLLWMMQPVNRGSRLPMSDHLERLFLALSYLISVVKEAYEEFLPDTISLCSTYLTDTEPSYRESAIEPVTVVLRALATHVGPNFRPYATHMLGPLVSALVRDNSPGFGVSKCVLKTFEEFGGLFAQYSLIALPALVAVIENTKVPPPVRVSAMEAVGKLIHVYDNIPHLLSSIVHPLVRVLGTARGEDSFLGRTAALVIQAAAVCAPENFKYFVPVAAKALLTNPECRDSAEFKGLEAALLRSSRDVASNILEQSRLSEDEFKKLVIDLEAASNHVILKADSLAAGSRISNSAHVAVPLSGDGSLQMDSESLMLAFDISGVTTGAEWTEWMDSLGAALLSHSGSPAMRIVGGIGELYPTLVRGLFNAAFLSCWPKVDSVGTDGEYQNKILSVFCSALRSQTIPLPAKQILLDLFEFMDHDERPLPLNPDLLARAALDVGAFAKAVRYKENQYLSCTTTNEYLDVIGHNRGLIDIYGQLGQTVSAVGTLKEFEAHAEDKTMAREVRERYNETLLLLPDARAHYEEALGKLPENIDLSTVNKDSERSGEFLYSDPDAEPLHDSALAVTARPAIPESAEERQRDKKWFLTLALLRVLDSLGEWREMDRLVTDVWNVLENNPDARASLAVGGRACSVAFDLGKWDDFSDRVSCIDDEMSWDKHFYDSLLCVHAGAAGQRDMLVTAGESIDKAREVLDAQLRTRAAEGYPRAYKDFLNAQHLVELEEMLQCLNEGKPKIGVERIKTLWSSRLDLVKQDQHTWYRLLMVRSLFLNPSENKEHWLKFATKCRKDHKLPMATEALRKLVGHVSEQTNFVEAEQKDLVQVLRSTSTPVSDWSVESLCAIPDRALQFACVKHVLAVDPDFNMPRAFHALRECMSVERIRRPGELVRPESPLPNTRQILPREPASHDHLYAEIYLKLAKWCSRVNSGSNVGWNEEGPRSSVDALSYASEATCWRPRWYKSWHFWATLNYAEAKKKLPRESGAMVTAFEAELPVMEDSTVARLSFAIEGFFSAISFGGKTSLEDVLTLLSLWFKYGKHTALSKQFDKRFSQSNPDQWLAVVPQIIARLHTRHTKVRQGIEKLLIHVGRAHPQAIVFPLTVAAETPGDQPNQINRRKAAELVLRAIAKREKKQTHDHSSIVDQAKILARELNRVAILEVEKWSERIEEASRLYYSDNNVVGMLNNLLPLHQELERTEPVTNCERNFRRDYGGELIQAGKLGAEYMELYRGLTAPIDDAKEAELQSLIDKACDCYLGVIRRIQKFRSRMFSLQLEDVSPRLSRSKDMVLAIPGQYSPHSGDVVTIHAFEARLEVMQSKQRPRKLQILGSDGKEYGFLLKGHDDLRQDERVMQVFSLINQHLARSEDRSVRQGAELKRYAIIVLSSSAGLIEWVPQCDTMHSIVKTFRENHKVMPNVEHKVMLRVAPDPERLPLINRVDLFEFMLANTGGRDIARVLWLRSRNSEMWLDRRTNFARTLATTSIAGYILGLGDRHPSNIMIERDTGKIMHIDFGDCFEVAMRRDKYPEKVPFRLTRMLVQALEPCGVSGHFRHMAVAMMKVLRQDNTKNAVMAMMEAFVYDPLLREKLLDGAELNAAKAAQNDGATSAAAGSVMHASAHGDLAEQYSEHGSLAAVVHFEDPDAVPDELDNALANHAMTPSEQNKSMCNLLLAPEGGVRQEIVQRMADNRASQAIERVREKLSGHDFPETVRALDPDEQVDRLIRDARSTELLCTSFVGWCASW